MILYYLIISKRVYFVLHLETHIPCTVFGNVYDFYSILRTWYALTSQMDTAQSANQIRQNNEHVPLLLVNVVPNS